MHSKSSFCSYLSSIFSLILLLHIAILPIYTLANAKSEKQNNNGFDHRAHAVIGGPYIASDINGNGFEHIYLDGSLSHSHYFNSNTGSKGRIVRYLWKYVPSNKVFCRSKRCSTKFPVGLKRIVLVVTDNTGDVASEATFVKVNEGVKPGVRFLIYKSSYLSPDFRKGIPVWSYTKAMFQLPPSSALPYVGTPAFSIRALAVLRASQSGQYSFRAQCPGGTCVLYIDGRKIASGSNQITSKLFRLTDVHNVQLTFRNVGKTTSSAQLKLFWKPPSKKFFTSIPSYLLSHLPGVLRPVVHSITPKVVAPGTTIKVSGSGFFGKVSVFVSGVRCDNVFAKTQYKLTCDVAGSSGKKVLSVWTQSGRSNRAPLEIRSSSRTPGNVGYFQPVKFTRTTIKQNGKDYYARDPASITLGPDGKYYIGSLTGVVHVINVDRSFKVRSACTSPSIGSSRSILGVAFNPLNGNKIRLYATSSTLFWKSIGLPDSSGWRNGEVIVMENRGGSCIRKVGTVISGLPVSNYDHGVNALSFDNYGRMLITVGSATNGGVPHYALGDVADSPLSGSMLIASVEKKGFNGAVKYSTPNNPATARKIGGQVDTYAVGLRNSFGQCVHSNGHIYATDNGGNPEFGLQSTGCNSQKRLSRREEDTLKKVVKNGFYGMANRNRGRTDKRQCVHKQPRDSGGFEKPLAFFESSTNGLIEYTANTFGAQMRGDLLASKYAVGDSGRVYRVKLDGSGNVKGQAAVLAQYSGLSITQGPTGALVMPRVEQHKLVVLAPSERNPNRLVVTTVNPFRGPRRGGVAITITGWNLRPPLSASVGGKPCGNPRSFAPDGRSFVCTVPSGAGKVPVTVSKSGKSSTSYGFEFYYMSL